MKLHYHPLSGHAHRVHLFLSLIGVAHELVEVDLTAGAHKQPGFLKLNRFGQVPVLEDEGTIVSDSNAILVYLAKKYRKTDWLPETPAAAAAVQRWLSVAAGQIAFGPAAARLVTLFGAKFNAEEVIGRAHAMLAIVDAELAGRSWIAAANRPSPMSRSTATSPARPRATSTSPPIATSGLAGPHRSAAGVRRVPESPVGLAA